MLKIYFSGMVIGTAAAILGEAHIIPQMLRDGGILLGVGSFVAMFLHIIWGEW